MPVARGCSAPRSATDRSPSLLRTSVPREKIVAHRLGRHLLLVVAVAGSVWIASPRFRVSGEPGRPGAAGGTGPALQWQGTSSCASAACHGNTGPPGSKGCEYTTWVSDDKHARAYEVLFDP